MVSHCTKCCVLVQMSKTKLVHDTLVLQSSNPLCHHRCWRNTASDAQVPLWTAALCQHKEAGLLAMPLHYVNCGSAGHGHLRWRAVHLCPPPVCCFSWATAMLSRRMPVSLGQVGVAKLHAPLTMLVSTNQDSADSVPTQNLQK